MEIFLQPPNPEALSFEVDFQIQQAIVALQHSSIAIHGAGRFGDGRAAIVLKHNADAGAALEALERAHVKVSHFVTHVRIPAEEKAWQRAIRSRGNQWSELAEREWDGA